MTSQESHSDSVAESSEAHGASYTGFSSEFPVLMSDGTIECIDAIQPGQTVMSVDHTPLRVLQSGIIDHSPAFQVCKGRTLKDPTRLMVPVPGMDLPPLRRYLDEGDAPFSISSDHRLLLGLVPQKISKKDGLPQTGEQQGRAKNVLASDELVMSSQQMTDLGNDIQFLGFETEGRYAGYSTALISYCRGRKAGRSSNDLSLMRSVSFMSGRRLRMPTRSEIDALMVAPADHQLGDDEQVVADATNDVNDGDSEDELTIMDLDTDILDDDELYVEPSTSQDPEDVNMSQTTDSSQDDVELRPADLSPEEKTRWLAHMFPRLSVSFRVTMWGLDDSNKEFAFTVPNETTRALTYNSFNFSNIRTETDPEISMSLDEVLRIIAGQMAEFSNRLFGVSSFGVTLFNEKSGGIRVYCKGKKPPGGKNQDFPFKANQSSLDGTATYQNRREAEQALFEWRQKIANETTWSPTVAEFYEWYSYKRHAADRVRLIQTGCIDDWHSTPGIEVGKLRWIIEMAYSICAERGAFVDDGRRISPLDLAILLGLWLGDGTARTTAIACGRADFPETPDFLRRVGEDMHLHLVQPHAQSVVGDKFKKGLLNCVVMLLSTKTGPLRVVRRSAVPIDLTFEKAYIDVELSVSVDVSSEAEERSPQDHSAGENISPAPAVAVQDHQEASAPEELAVDEEYKSALQNADVEEDKEPFGGWSGPIERVESNVKAHNVFWTILELLGVAGTKKITEECRQLILNEDVIIREGVIKGLMTSDGHTWREEGKSPRMTINQTLEAQNAEGVNHHGILRLVRDVARSLGVRAYAHQYYGKRPTGTFRQGVVSLAGPGIIDFNPLLDYKHVTGKDFYEKTIEWGFTSFSLVEPEQSASGEIKSSRTIRLVLEGDKPFIGGDFLKYYPSTLIKKRPQPEQSQSSDMSQD